MSRSKHRRRGYCIRMTLTTATKRLWHRTVRRAAHRFTHDARFDLEVCA